MFVQVDTPPYPSLVCNGSVGVTTCFSFLPEGTLPGQWTYLLPVTPPGDYTFTFALGPLSVPLLFMEETVAFAIQPATGLLSLSSGLPSFLAQRCVRCWEDTGVELELNAAAEAWTARTNDSKPCCPTSSASLSDPEVVQTVGITNIDLDVSADVSIHVYVTGEYVFETFHARY